MVLGGANAVTTAADATRGGTYERSFREGQGRGVVFGGGVLHDYVRRDYDKNGITIISDLIIIP